MRFLVLFLLFFPHLILADDTVPFSDVKTGMTQSDFLNAHPMSSVRSYRHSKDEQWLSYLKNSDSKDIYTFHFSNDRLSGWQLNDRSELIEEYLSEFCSLQDFPVIFTAIKNVLSKMPYADFITVTDRRRPVIFVEVYDSGTARFASSQEFIMTKDEPPCCQEGFTLLKLGLGLGLSKTPEPMEGVIAHELAHRVLDHIRKGKVNCQAEREANALIKKWGFNQEFKEASQVFGHKNGDPAGCKEEN